MAISIPEFHKQMKQWFSLRGAGKFLDVEMSLIGRRASLDVVKFDDWLHTQVGNYEDSGLNMEQALVQKYGEGAAAFVRACL